MADEYEYHRHFDGHADAVGSSVFAEARNRAPHIAPSNLWEKGERDFSDGKRPLICVTPRWMPGQDQFSASQSIADVEMDAIVSAGGMPVMMPLTKDLGLIREYVDMCDGFTIPGGHSVNPRKWGEEPTDPNDMAPARDALEFPLTEMVVSADKPLLCVCRGMQLLNVACGGTICQYLYDMKPRPGMTHWRHGVILDRPAHPVEVKPDTLLARVMGGRELIQTNSSHHECVKELGHGLVISGYSTDGIIEAIEMPGKKFVLGVQWHPEYTWRALNTDFALWRSLVLTAAGRDI